MKTYTSRESILKDIDAAHRKIAKAKLSRKDTSTPRSCFQERITRRSFGSVGMLPTNNSARSNDWRQ